jgi:hypothetical protein
VAEKKKKTFLVLQKAKIKMEEPVSHVLYISTNCRVCHALRGKGIPRSVRVENVIDIIPRPAWLDGTPTLVDVNVGVLYKGSDALIVLDHMRQSQLARPPPQPVQQSQPPPQHQLPHQAPPLRPVQEEAPKPTNETAINWAALFKPPVDEPVEDTKRTSGLAPESIAEMISRRALQTPPPTAVR